MQGSNARAERTARQEARRSAAEARKDAGRDAPWRRQWRRFRRTLGQAAIRGALPPVIRGLGATWRVEFDGRQHFEDLYGNGFLAAIWHGRMLPLLPRHRREGHAVLVSPSKDGELVAVALKRNGYSVIRGSSSRSGAQALREMRDTAASGSGVVITPDGPRGPRHSTNVGLAWLARETELPILPIGVAVERAWQLKSWDRFVIPKPRSRVRIHYGAPLRVAPEANDDTLESVTTTLREAMLGLERQGFDALGIEPDF